MKVDGAKIRQRREDIGMSLSELARRAKITRTQMTNIELRSQSTTRQRLKKIADILKWSSKELL